ncbi:MAG: hypothetical protein LBE50_05470 [Gallionellaceae bacterium]|jgi:hypothetical protein|nr:hypothetical protein [Gallionellaceae bacterium]
MSQQDLSKAKDPDLRNSQAAMKRAAQMARKIAIQTNTAIVVMKDGKTMRISAEQLREQGGQRD